MSRATYVKHLEHDLEAYKRTVNELIQENHELRENLKAVSQRQNEPTSKASSSQY